MMPTTALTLLKYLAREGLLDTQLTTFIVPRHPQPVDVRDVREAFEALVDHVRGSPRDIKFSFNFGIEVWTHERLFEKLFRAIFVLQKIVPEGKGEGSGGREAGAPLPSLTVGSEKTQVRQIPLAQQRPWPFRFLLELGGMVVVKTERKRAMLLELKQFLNNHPQFEIKVHAEECPDGSVAIFTYWFREVGRLERKHNVNVPSNT